MTQSAHRRGLENLVDRVYAVTVEGGAQVLASPAIGIMRGTQPATDTNNRFEVLSRARPRGIASYSRGTTKYRTCLDERCRIIEKAHPSRDLERLMDRATNTNGLVALLGGQARKSD